MLAKGELQCSRGIRRQSQANLQTPVPLFSLAATLQKYLYLSTIAWGLRRLARSARHRETSRPVWLREAGINKPKVRQHSRILKSN